MPPTISCAEVADLLAGDQPFALIDVRESGEYNSSHIVGASLIPRRELELRIVDSVPHADATVVLCDDDGRRAELAAETLRGLGYRNAVAMAGGMARWVTERRPTEWGVNVPSKDFGEKVQVQHHVPEIDAVELQSRMDRGDKMVILDTRTPEEYQRNCIPGGRSVPNGELALYISDILSDVDDDTTVIINCAGRTRSIIGTRLLQRMGVENVVGLENGTAGWVLAGYQLEYGADRLDLPEPTEDGLAAAERYADQLVEQDGVRYIDVSALDSLMERRTSETVYLVDVRTDSEYAGGHIPGFRWFPGGQAVQRADEVAVVHNAPIVFCCDGRARAAFAASWYRLMGFEEVYALHGGTSAWAESGRVLESGAPDTGMRPVAGKSVTTVTADEVAAASPSTRIIHVGLSAEFAQGHVPGASWIPRGWLEFRIDDVAPDKDAPIVVTCLDGGAQSALAAATLTGLGYTDVSTLQGGTGAWRASGRDAEVGLTGVMSPPNDNLPMGPDRGYADMVNYLRWEEELGHKYASAD
ncbi:MAG: sulfurtransferase [Dehalococcoidia bacterium]|nr:sulfurtransferase [Dehalococcoidia bacterium]